MTNDEDDILLEIPDEDLPKLAKMYEKHKDWAPNIHSMIMMGIDWKKKRKDKILKFMSPNGCWREDGTFFVTLSHYSFDIVIFSLDYTAKNIYEGIQKTKRLCPSNYKDRDALLYSIHDEFYPSIVKSLQDKGFSMSLEIPCYIYYIPGEEAEKFEINCPPEVYIKRLDASNAELVNSIWPHRYKNSVKFVTLLIEMNESCGLFLKSTNELVSWALLSMMGQLGLVQTVDAHKRKGYGSLTVKYISKIIASKQENPYGTVLKENVVSRKMFEKLGFRNVGVSTDGFFR